MLKLQESEVDGNERPLHPYKIVKTQVSNKNMISETLTNCKNISYCLMKRIKDFYIL